ncbi:MAG: M48 family metalloprotease [Pseudomonadota bacterium]
MGVLRTLLTIVATTAMVVIAGSAAPTATAQDFELPNIGSPADALLPRTEEARIGRQMMRMFYQQELVVDDPELTEYINAIGNELVGHANNGDYSFEFFVVADPSVNAFALPGGYIGVHTGLIQLTRGEDELASVLAHEIAHVTQRHIARTIHDNSRASILTMAALLGAIALGAATGAGGEALEGALATTQAVSIQNQINFTRGYEYEADRIGISTLAAAGFEANAMADFFARMGRRTNSSLNQSLNQFEYLRTHPVSSSRTAEAKARARLITPTAEREESVSYGLMKARTHALYSESPVQALAYFQDDSDASEYGRALVALADDEPEKARDIFEALIEDQQEVIAYHIGLAQALVAADDLPRALETLERAQRLFPRNVPLTIRHATVLLDSGRAEAAHDLLLDLLNTVPPTPEQVRLIARAAIDAGEIAEAHYYMAEYNIMTGNLVQAVILLRRASRLAGVSDIQRARFLARADFVSEYLSEEQRLEVRRDPGRS